MGTQTEILSPDTPPELQPIRLRTARDMTLVTASIEHRVAELRGLAKKNRTEGYDKEARTMENDASALEYHVLPQVKHQQELPLTTVEQVREGIATGIHDIIRQGIVVRSEEGKLDRNLREAIHDMAAKLAVRIESLAERVAIDGYAAGYAAREAEPTSIVKRALPSIYE